MKVKDLINWPMLTQNMRQNRIVNYEPLSIVNGMSMCEYESKETR